MVVRQSHEIRVDMSAMSTPVQPAETREQSHDPEAGDRPPVDIPGYELPAAVYVSVAAAFAWMMVAAIVAFGRQREADFTLAMAAVLMIIFLGLPLLIYMAAIRRSGHATGPKGGLSSRIDTATGSLSTGAAWLQILLIPAALAVAATVIGAVFIATVSGW